MLVGVALGSGLLAAGFSAGYRIGRHGVLNRGKAVVDAMVRRVA